MEEIYHNNILMNNNQIAYKNGFNSNQFIPPFDNRPGCWEYIGRGIGIAVVASLLNLLLGC